MHISSSDFAAGVIGFLILRRHFILILLSALSCLNLAVAEETQYQLGMGYELNDAFTVGGYFSTEYGSGKEINFFGVDDLAFLVYGENDANFSYFFELEWSELYKIDYENNEEEQHTRPFIERLYGDYKYSDYLSVRFGKQITPIGYWNLQPINVLRETTSNPILSRRMFPKFLTGIDIYGYTPIDENLTYHLYLQGTKDLDNERINIDADRHVGLSLEKDFQNGWKLGTSLGNFREVNKDKTRYFQFNARFDQYRYSFITESNFSRKDPDIGKVERIVDIYVQTEYRFRPKHTLIGRVEYFHNDELGLKERIGVLAYGYRIRYPISLKIEYQLHADSNDNQLLTSFSVLF